MSALQGLPCIQNYVKMQHVIQDCINEINDFWTRVRDDLKGSGLWAFWVIVDHNNELGVVEHSFLSTLDVLHFLQDLEPSEVSSVKWRFQFTRMDSKTFHFNQR